jgi:hypothetical protein
MITRYNYEEFFLLFVDNELSPAEKKAVEEFVKQSPDLEEELAALQQSVLKPENNILFENKDLLLKQTEENSLINQTNYEEYFLLYIDNELDHAAKKDVEKHIHENPSLQNELSLLQQAKLGPDTAIVFERKDILYKKEEKKRPIPFAWMSAAAVAILLVTGFLFYNNKLQHPNQSTASVQGTKTNEKGSLIEKNKKEEIAVTQPPVDSLNNKEEVKARMIAKDNKQEKQAQVDRYAINKQNKKTGNKNDIVAIIGSKPKEGTQPKNAKPIEIEKANSGNEKEISTSLAVSGLNAKPNNLIAKTDHSDETGKTNTEAFDVILVAMNDNNVGYIDTDNTSAKKNKLRGIFRRVSRVFEKTTNVDDGNRRSVAIGSFQIALK